MPHRTAFWTAHSTLLLADLHIGKGETLAAGGVPVPKGIVESDLARLSAAVELTQATRVLVLGDLLHAPIGIVPALVEQVAAWRRSIPAQICLIPGNHDRRIGRVAEAWDIRVCDDVIEEGPFIFVHDADHAPADSSFVWSGHLHPRVGLKGGGDSLSLPCFLVGERGVLLPAFSRFTAGTNVSLSAGERAWGIAEDMLVEVTGTRGRERARIT